jgi:hypothetical protein
MSMSAGSLFCHPLWLAAFIAVAGGGLIESPQLNSLTCATIVSTGSGATGK